MILPRIRSVKFLMFFVFLVNGQLSYSDGENKSESDGQRWNNLAEKLIEMSIDFENDREYIENNKKEIEKLLESKSDSAFYWYLHAKLIVAHLSVYYLENKYTKFKEMRDFYKDEYVIAQREIVFSNYEKALNLNKSAGPEEKLNYRMLDSIAADLGAPYQTRVEALRQLLMIPEKEVPRHGDVHGNRVLGVYQDIVTAYLDGKDFDGALAVLDEIREEFPHLRVEIEQATNDVLARKQTETEVAAQQASEEKTPGSALKQEKSKEQDLKSLSDEKTGHQYYIFSPVPVAFGLLAVVIYIFYRRRKK